MKPEGKTLTVQVISKENLTKTELITLTLLCQGLTRREIAQARHRSIATISKQIENVAGKLDSHSHAEIVAVAVARGIVSISLQAVVLLIAGLLLMAATGHVPVQPIEAHWVGKKL